MHKQTNILLIFSDQQHWEAMGSMDPFFHTPNHDAFARENILFERAFCTTPQCSPSRSTMLTGFYPSVTGVMGNVGAAGGEPLRLPTIGTEWQAAGYRTAYFGKWHLGNDPVGTAGWDEHTFKIDDPLAETEAVRFLESTQGSSDPFALVVSINNPHDIYSFLKHVSAGSLQDVPLQESWEKETFEGKPGVQRQYMEEDQGKAIDGAPRETWQQYRDCYREKTRLYDEQVGHILEALDSAGHREDTVVIITSDHGDMDAQHRLIFKGPFFYEHMIRVPLMIRIPKSFGAVSPRRVNDIDIVNTDLVPTLREICGLPAKESHGHSFLPLLTGSGTYEPRDCVIGQYYSKQKWVNPMRMIRTGKWKYIRHLGGEGELYSLDQDPHELCNRIHDPELADQIRELDAKLDNWMHNIQDPFSIFHPTDRQGKPLTQTS